MQHKVKLWVKIKTIQLLQPYLFQYNDQIAGWKNVSRKLNIGLDMLLKEKAWGYLKKLSEKRTWLKYADPNILFLLFCQILKHF